MQDHRDAKLYEVPLKKKERGHFAIGCYFFQVLIQKHTHIEALHSTICYESVNM